LTLPIAALGALITALIETSVLPEMPIFGAYPNLLLTFVVVAAIVMGFEDGMVWAFVGGVMIDLLTPGRPIGAVTLTLLLVVGLSVAGARVFGRTRLAAAVGTFAMTWVFHALFIVILALTEGIALAAFDVRLVFLAALINMVVAALIATLLGALERRFGNPDRERTAW
jgi:rod shape-determining protein MreD